MRDCYEDLVNIAENYDSKVRLLFQLRNYISLVKYDPYSAKKDRTSEFRRFVASNQLDVWSTIQDLADTRKVSKRVQQVKRDIEDMQNDLRAKRLKNQPSRTPRQLRGAALRAFETSGSKAQKRKYEFINPSGDGPESFYENGQFEVDPELGFPNTSKRAKTEINLITSPIHYIKPVFGGVRNYLNSFKTITDDLEPITPENWAKKVETDSVSYAKVMEAKRSGRLDKLMREGVGNEVTIPKFVDPPPETPGWYDHYLNHMIHYAKLQSNLRKYHQSIVKRGAQGVEQYFRRLAGAEDRERKELDRQLRQLARKVGQEVMKKWKLAEKVVEQRREAILAEEKRERGKEYLNQILDKSAKLITSRVGGDGLEEEEEDDDEDEEEDDEEEEEEEEEEIVNDEELTLEQLREKYKNLPDIEESEGDDDDDDDNEDNEEVEKPSEEALRIYAETKGDSDESVSESESGSEEEEGESSEEESEEERPKFGLAALLGGKAVEEDEEDDEDAVISEESEAEDEEEVKTEIKEESETESKEDADVDMKDEEPGADSEVKDEAEEVSNDSSSNKELTAPVHGLHRIEPPFLLKGTLREYQRNGLDWLAGLVQSGTNGILADEMGLGKTIQTIALLSWLACEKEIWGPHLIVVPTSVMLNWEMEFKRFAPGFKILTYFGTPQQRKRKRRGWNKEDTWHVCITSYQLVIQDQVVFRGKRWQYMVLDEAHNIKNFRSQRWQALLNFNAQHRLLLTGTPLQNNLVELWSLLYFLMPSSRATQMMPAGFASLDDFQEWFAKPVDQMVEEGEEADEEAKKTISKLHQVLRPYLLRRLKIDVEKQMPGKYEHVVYCRLSKRQRYLYDDFMSRASTRATLESGNFMSILNCLMQLRKVCNHPDLFEVRPIVTSYAIDHHVAREYALNVAPKFTMDFQFENFQTLDQNNFVFSQFETGSRLAGESQLKLSEGSEYLNNELNNLLDELNEDDEDDVEDEKLDLTTVAGYAKLNLHKRRAHRVHRKQAAIRINKMRSSRIPLFGTDCLKLLRVFKQPIMGVLSYVEREESVKPILERYAFVTPAVTVLDYPHLILGEISEQVYDPSSELAPITKGTLFHEPQVRLSVAFPDKRLLQYDCGKLQKLAVLLRDLIGGGHRCLIFTQMTKVLDILEQFLNLHGWRYLRLDGATRIEQRQALTERFNKDASVPVFILSTRSGGLGINLTGADTVIFYDSDWNPAMDKQCQDRCHRIGQTRDVHIYRLVSEFTIESNILRKATQKTILDNVVIQEGEFTTEYFSKLSVQDILGNDAGRSAAQPTIEELQGAGPKKLEDAMAQAEDRDDQVAANLALNEAQMDEQEFAENKKPQDGEKESGKEEDEEEPTKEIGHIDDWMIHALENYDLY